MAGGTIHKTIEYLQNSLHALGADLSPLTVERLGVMINRAMNASERSFHTPEHIFDLADPFDPYRTLAALFHDLVYFQVDQGFDPEIGQLVEPYIIIDQGKVSLVPAADPNDIAFWGTVRVFGFEPGQVLSPFGGLNEFLSALVFSLSFYGHLANGDMLAVVASIEATIPFRPNDPQGHTPMELLYGRIKDLNQVFELGLSEEVLKSSMRRAILFANKDVENFSENDAGRFLDNTWKLLPETNPELRTRGVFTISNYRTALMKMEGFLGFLNPDVIFGSFESVPPKAQLEVLQSRARRNVELGRSYLGIKLTTAAILEALAMETGGDVPVAYFMGHISDEGSGATLSAQLPQPPAAVPQGLNQELFSLLAHGRASESRFDLKNSPLSLFIYLSLGARTLGSCLESARAFCKDELSAFEFLKKLPLTMVATIASAIASLAQTRKAAFDQLVEQLGQ